MGSIFISYAHEDKIAVLELYEALKNQGFPLWIDDKNLLPGENWEAEIERAIHECDVFIACLSNNSVNKRGYVQAELKRALKVADLMPEGEVYIIPIRLDECKVPNSLSRWHWLDYYNDNERDKLFRAIRQRISNSDGTTVENEKFFNAGERLVVVRNELMLSSSQFIEMLDISSQREYEKMESSEKEVPISILTKICNLSGANLEWLKHGKGQRYNIGTLYLKPIEKDLEYCESLNPKEYFLTVESKSLHVGVVVQTGDYRYQVLDTGVTLDFWNWFDSHWAIPAFYKFLKDLSDPWHDIYGLILPPKYEKKLYEGDVHFLTARWNATRYGRSLLYDILDINETRAKFSSYSKIYNGNWMHKVHESFKKYIKDDVGGSTTGVKSHSFRSIIEMSLGGMLPLFGCIIVAIASASRYFLEGKFSTNVGEIVTTSIVYLSLLIISFVLFMVGFGGLTSTAFNKAAKIHWIDSFKVTWNIINDILSGKEGFNKQIEAVKNTTKSLRSKENWLDPEFKDRSKAALMSLVIPGWGLYYRDRKLIGISLFLLTLIGYVAEAIPGLLIHLITIALSGVLDKPKT